MIVIIYANNEAFTENDETHTFDCIGTNETFGIPAVRPAPYGKKQENAVTIHKDGHKIIAFYTCLSEQARADYARQYNIEYQRRNSTKERKREMLRGVKEAWISKREALV